MCVEDTYIFYHFLLFDYLYPQTRIEKAGRIVAQNERIKLGSY